MIKEWRGDEIRAKMVRAAKWGIDKTMSKAVVYAKSQLWLGHGLRTATLQGSIQMRPAEERGRAVVGQWGSFDVHYAIFVELGTSRMKAIPYLRPAADVEYPKLAKRIKAAFGR